MPVSKRPKTEEEWVRWCKAWDEGDHGLKMALAYMWDITYGTAKHWRSDCGVQLPLVYQPKPVIQLASISEPLDLVVTDTTTLAIIGDTHNPYQDPIAIALVEQFLDDQQPDYLIYNGDINDFYQASSFAKEPTRVGQFQSDIDDTKRMLDRHNKLLPNTAKILLSGTHEYRWIKYLQKTSSAVASLGCMSIPELFGLNDLGIKHVDYERGLLINGTFLVMHGDIAATHSAYTAKRHYDKNGGSGLCNHTHRGGSYYKRDRFGSYGWWENFCLCRLDPDWIQNPNWMQGFSMLHFTGSSRFWLEQIPIIDGTLMYGGKLYR